MSGNNLSRGYSHTINCVGVPLSLCTCSRQIEMNMQRCSRLDNIYSERSELIILLHVGHSGLQSQLAHLYLYISDDVRNVMMSWRNSISIVLTLFFSCYGNPLMLLAITFDCLSILQRAIKQFGAVASSK